MVKVFLYKALYKSIWELIPKDSKDTLLKLMKKVTAKAKLQENKNVKLTLQFRRGILLTQKGNECPKQWIEKSKSP